MFGTALSAFTLLNSFMVLLLLLWVVFCLVNTLRGSRKRRAAKQAAHQPLSEGVTRSVTMAMATHIEPEQ